MAGRPFIPFMITGHLGAFRPATFADRSCLTMSSRQPHLVPLALAAAMSVASATSAQSKEVNVYTYREQKLIQPLFDAFTKDTGIKVNVISASTGLEQRIRSEGDASPADVLLTVDIGRLEQAVRAGVSQPIKSAVLDRTVPPRYRDAEGHWYAISMRARVVYASKERVAQDAITYEELVDPKWKGRICIRSGQHMYNNALFAAMIAKHGEAKAEEWLRGVKANLAQKPSGGDRETARDVAAGRCDLGIGNTYYWALMATNPAQKPWADATKVILPTFRDGGTHVNVSGVVLARYAPNAANAMTLIEWLADEKAQHMYADINYEYPIRGGVAVNPIIAGYGELKPDDLPLAKVADNAKTAATLVDKVGFDN
jgi:iron(III) transport system substrate-binding protein